MPPSTSRPSSFAIDLPAALLVRARSGEAAALEAIYRAFERPVYTLGLRLCGSPDEARDVLQDTMVRVIDRIGTWRGDGAPFWGWLRQVAVNECLMRLRRRRELDDLDPLLDSLADDLAPPPPAAGDAAALQRALAQLPATTRSVLWLYHAEGYTHEEIAALMTRSVSFSKSQLARGTRRLRGLLEPRSTAREVTHA